MGKMGPIEPDGLFRSETIEARRFRIAGDVLVRSPLVSMPATLGLPLLVVAAVVTSLSLPFSREFRAAGWVAPELGVIDVRSPGPGTVASVFTKEGALVHLGDRLLALSTDSRLEGGGSLGGEMVAANRAKAGLLDARERELAVGFGAKVRADTAHLESLRIDRTRLVTVLELKRKNMAAKIEQLARYQDLIRRGFGSGLEHQRRQSEQLTAQQEVVEGEMRLASIDRDMEEVRQQTAQARSAFSLAMNEAGQQRAALAADLAQTTARQAVSVAAPTSGTLTRLHVKPGQAVSTGAPLLSIIPPGRFEIQLLAPAQASDLPEIGARARVLVDAFPFARFGALSGRVKSIARTVAQPDDTTASIGVKVPYFLIVVELDPNQPALVGRARLRAGMTVAGRLELEKRSLLHWLLPR